MKFTVNKGTLIIALVSALLLTAVTLAVSAEKPVRLPESSCRAVIGK